MRKKKSTLQKANEYLRYWVPKLRLRDWNFNIEIVTDPGKIGSYASAHINPNYQYVDIRLLEPEKVPENWKAASSDIEVSVVHELLHIRMFHLPALNKKQQYHEEMIIETIAMALVSERRGVSLKDLI